MEKFQKEIINHKNNKSLVGDIENIRETARDMLENKVINRDLECYLDSLGIDDISYLKGKIIPDIGAKKGLFAKEGGAEGLDITAMDLAYSIDKGRKTFLEDHDPNVPPKAVAALAQQMPFKNNQFDLITSMCSAFSYVRTVFDIQQNLKESLRVLKGGGELRIYPLAIFEGDPEPLLIIYENEDSSKLSDIFFRIISKMKEKGVIDFRVGQSRDPDDDYGNLTITKLK